MEISIIYERTQSVGEWERSRRLPETERYTWYYTDFGSYVLKEFVTPEQLSERYKQATAAQSPVADKSRGSGAKEDDNLANGLPSKKEAQRLRERYPAGTRVELVSMDDPYCTLKPGDRGGVDFIDDTGTVIVKWDGSSNLGLLYGVDRFKLANERALEPGDQEKQPENCSEQIGVMMKRELSDDERAFCRSLFGTAFQASTDCLDIERVVYPYDIPTARKRLETDACHASANRNAECARAIDAAIHASSYKTFHYNLDLAAMKMILDYGFPRVNAVLSRQLRVSDYDGRYSRANLTWARGFSAVDTAFRYAHLDAHPTLLDSFTKYVRDFYDELGAERFALAGRETSGEIVAGYEIIRSVTFGDGQGFAIAHNPEAISPYVVWQFKRDDGAINAFWGYYCSDERAAADNYTLRAAIHDQLLRKEEIHATAAPDQSPEPASGIAFSLAKWREADDAIDAPWREDARYREHKDGALFYKGGENGQYLRVSSNGTITVGRYAHAKPGIEDAVLTAGISQQLPSYDHALLLAAHLGGERFRSDLFGESVSLAAAIESRLEAGKPEAEPIVQPITDASGNTYTSVLGAIDRAKSAPKPPRKAKAPDRQKSGEEL